MGGSGVVLLGQITGGSIVECVVDSVVACGGCRVDGSVVVRIGRYVVGVYGFRVVGGDGGPMGGHTGDTVVVVGGGCVIGVVGPVVLSDGPVILTSTVPDIK